MKILVAGGYGFIGINLIKRLLLDNHKIVILDNLSTSLGYNFKSTNVSFIKEDICKMNPVIFKDVDFIFNLAYPAAVFTSDVNRCIDSCYVGYKNLLMLATKLNIRIVHLSSSSVYGDDPKICPQNENYNGNLDINSYKNVYQESKRLAEVLSSTYIKTGTKLTVVRLFDTYGIESSLFDNRVIPTFIRNILKKEPVTLYGIGVDNRSYTYIDDVIDALIKLLYVEYFGVINIGNAATYSVTEVYNKIKMIVNVEPTLIFNDKIQSYKEGISKPDLTLASKVLNWSPKISLDVGLPLTIDYYKALLKIK